jgi:xanthine dehydrogenase FAD-binding subunit
MREFDYEAPRTLTAAIELLSRADGRARALAGGTDLIDHVRTGRHAPDLIVDVKKIPELTALELNAEGLSLGAAVPCFRIYEDPRICERYAALADSCRIIGGIQIQSRASVGGNLCNSGPAADSIPSLIALGATCMIAGRAGVRRVPAESFCTGPGTNVLKPGELLVELRFPATGPRSGSHYRRFIPRNEMDIAVVGVAAAVALDEERRTITAARIALGAIAPTPLFAADASQLLIGRRADDAEAIEEAARAARRIARPIDDMRGTIEFRLHVTEVLVRRVLEAAIGQARGENVEHNGKPLPGRSVG